MWCNKEMWNIAFLLLLLLLLLSLLLIKRKLQHHPPPPGKPVEIPNHSSQNGVEMPHPMVVFVCQTPLLKNSRRRFHASVIKLVNIHCTSRHQFKMESDLWRWLLGTRCALRTRKAYNLVSLLRGMLFEWQFISQSVFHLEVFFFLLVFTAVLWLYNSTTLQSKIINI